MDLPLFSSCTSSCQLHFSCKPHWTVPLLFWYLNGSPCSPELIQMTNDNFYCFISWTFPLVTIWPFELFRKKFKLFCWTRFQNSLLLQKCIFARKVTRTFHTAHWAWSRSDVPTFSLLSQVLRSNWMVILSENRGTSLLKVYFSIYLQIIHFLYSNF